MQVPDYEIMFTVQKISKNKKTVSSKEHLHNPDKKQGIGGKHSS